MQHYCFEAELLLKPRLLSPTSEHIKDSHVGLMVHDLGFCTLPDKFHKSTMLPNKSSRFLRCGRGHLRHLLSRLMLPPGELWPLSETGEYREEPRQQPIHLAGLCQVPWEPLYLIEPCLQQALLHRDLEHLDPAFPLSHVCPPVSHYISEPGCVMIFIDSIKYYRQASAMLDLQESVVSDLLGDFRCIVLCLQGMLILIFRNGPLNRVGNPLFVRDLGQLLCLFDVGWGVLQPSVKNIGGGCLLRM